MASPRPFKILSDFDGVWTDQTIEAESVKLLLAAEAARLAGVAAGEALRDFRRYEDQARAQPERHGWAPDGRITAYVDEDPFCVPNAVAGWLQDAAGERPGRYRAAILDAGYATLTAFADHCFLTATERYRTDHPPAILPGAKEHLEELLDRGVEVVIVSNSGAEKIVGWFRGIGIDAGTARGHALRVVGSARKFEIGTSGETIEVRGRPVHVDRPRYRAVIEAERPDLIVGDVFSLDLALPHRMREQDHPAAPRTLVLRRHAHTPDWIQSTRADGAIDHVVDSVGELSGLLPA